MKLKLESTTKIVDLFIDGATVQARVWEGQTEGGIACFALITRVAVKQEKDASEFIRDLQEMAAPSAAIAAFPSRIIL